jgi:predicted O-methyltransferase YrrM
VLRAVAATRALDFPLACTPEVGRLLGVLAATVVGGTIGELGTACGVGAAWIACGMGRGTRLVTVEHDSDRAAAAAEVFGERPDVTVLNGDWELCRDHAPFDLVFGDGGFDKHDPDAPAVVAPLLKPGGALLLDDFTPASTWTAEERERYENDATRRIWLEAPSFRAIELQVAPRMSVILAVRGR